MRKRQIINFLILILFLFAISCDLFEPLDKKGSIVIILEPEEKADGLGKSIDNKMAEGGLENGLHLLKTEESLSSVQCIVKKGSTTKYDDYLTKNGSYFEGTISDLDPGSDYSVLLYGKNSSGDIIGRGYKSSINVSAGKETTVSISWQKPGTVTDIDGNIYQTIMIGDQWWMAENLKVTHYRNGDPIPNVTDDTEWTGLSSGAYCAYDNNENNAETYGYLYNWYAVDDSRNIAPEGWHVPTDEEWKTLEMYLGMSQSEADDIGWRGTNEGSKLTGNASLWVDGNLETNAEFGTTGFSALPGGYRNDIGNFYAMSGHAYFWSSTESSSGAAWDRSLHYSNSVVARYDDYKGSGFSVRLVRD